MFILYIPVVNGAEVGYMRPLVSSIGIIFAALFLGRNRIAGLAFESIALFGAVAAACTVALFLVGRFLLPRLSEKWFPLSLLGGVLLPLIMLFLLQPQWEGGWAVQLAGSCAGFVIGILFYGAVGCGTYAAKGRSVGLSLLEWLGLRLFLFPQLVLMVLIVVSMIILGFVEGSVLIIRYPLLQHAAGMLLFIGMLLLMPFLLRHLFPFEALTGELAERLNAFADGTGIRYRSILVWKTGRRSILNACVAGIVPWSRYVFFTDALLQSLTPAEVESVFAHELSHVRHRHILSLLVFVFGATACFVGLYTFIEPYPHLEKLFTATWWVFFLLVPFARISRILELQADLGAIRLGADPAALVDSLEKLEAMTGTRNKKHSWRHFSIPYRVASIRKFLSSESFRAEFRRRKNGALAVVLGFFISGLVFAGMTGAYTFPDQRTQEFQIAELFYRKGERRSDVQESNDYFKAAEKKLLDLLEQFQLETVGTGWTKFSPPDTTKKDFRALFPPDTHSIMKRESLRRDCYLLLGKLYRKQGEKDNARKAAEKAKRIFRIPVYDAETGDGNEDAEETRETGRKTEKPPGRDDVTSPDANETESEQSSDAAEQPGPEDQPGEAGNGTD